MTSFPGRPAPTCERSRRNRTLRWSSRVLLSLAAPLLAGCPGPRSPGPSPTPPPAPLAQPRFREVAAASGVVWRHEPCRTGRKLLPETYGGGGGWIDYDRDGWLDLLVLNGAPLPGYGGAPPRHGLFRNLEGKGFREVAGAAGILSREYAQGCATGDWDNDGWTDLIVTGVQGSRLYRNDRGRFRDVTAQAGVGAAQWSTGAAWIDYDRDGLLDLFVASYVEWTPTTDIPCGPPGNRQYCPPHQYRGAPPRLWRNRGNGRFEDVSRRAGVLGHPSKTLAALPCDLNEDGWTDLYLANDTEPDVLLVGRADGSFAEEGATSGISVSAAGKPTGSMGIDVAAPFEDGRPVIAVGTFVGEGMSLFAVPPGPASTGIFLEHRGQSAGVTQATLSMSTFGLLFSDVENDGWPDLLAVNGHLDEGMADGQAFRQPPQLFQNRRDGTFHDVAGPAGIAAALVGRGLAAADWDNDGRIDFAAWENGGPVRLWHNESQAGAWLGLELVGRKAPRCGTGVRVEVRSGGRTQSRLLTTSRSYLSACEPRLHFGLGGAGDAEVTLHWPAGRAQVLRLPAGSYHRIEQP